MSTTPEPSATAVHEAAHAVVAVALGLTVRRVVVTGDTGRVMIAPSDDHAALAVTAMAGPIATRLHAGGTPRFTDTAASHGDAGVVAEALQKLSPGAVDLSSDRVFLRLQAEAVRLVTGHWHCIVAVARALDRFGELSGDEIKRAIEARAVA